MRMSRLSWNFGGGPVSIRLRSQLPAGELTADVAQHFVGVGVIPEITRYGLKSAKKDLNVRSQQVGSPKRWFWFLPQHDGQTPEPAEDESEVDSLDCAKIDPSTSDQVSACSDWAPDDSSTSESRVDSKVESSAAPESGAACGAAAEEDYDAQRDELGVVPALSNNGERGAPVFETETNPVPPGGWTDSTLGRSDRVKRALASTRTTVASTVDDTEGEVMA
jgi:hypothetical protein